MTRITKYKITEFLQFVVLIAVATITIMYGAAALITIFQTCNIILKLTAILIILICASIIFYIHSLKEFVIIFIKISLILIFIILLLLYLNYHLGI